MLSPAGFEPTRLGSPHQGATRWPHYPFGHRGSSNKGGWEYWNGWAEQNEYYLGCGLRRFFAAFAEVFQMSMALCFNKYP
ncbi:hypothetical protein I7I53_00121 [Histoplasma capsulatum var. duboisii H88]|uniref:Uncharacterized protein n=1 Tax=Ajellomyces capsulatus (strain H88) TaxID=544711 RepID=A0A8A1LF37_AJEC8|nr:hypothetical protein I7I53_00121 [Histoplasma capsulatum var. duboisii H88]